MDITGGSPEMNPHFEWFLGEAAKIADEVIVRSNVAILDMPEYARFAKRYAELGIHVVTSLPYFNEKGCDLQRGRNVFDRIIAMIRVLNDLGYGRDPRLKLDIAYNVSGPFLPPDQRELEEYYAYELEREQGIVFDNLYAFNNYALGRFAHYLKREGKFEYYLDLLADNYNGAVVARMMCRSQVNVDWDGTLYDCEVNHVLGLPITEAACEAAAEREQAARREQDAATNGSSELDAAAGLPVDGWAHPCESRALTVADIVCTPLPRRRIATNPICYSCAAGCGSSCGGSLMEKYAE